MIELRELSKSYDGGKSYAVRELSLIAAEGELLVLLGPSGCGKTTTLKMINRLVEPSGGSILIDGEDVRGQPAASLRRRIGYVFQSFGLFPHMTVGENIAIVPQLLGWEQQRIDERVGELLAAVSLREDYVARYPGALSGGQQQRVGFARALAARPRLLLMDEPFGALDPMTRDALQRDFQQLRRAQNLTAIMVTHDMAEAMMLADRIAVLRDGELVQAGTPTELANAPADDFVAELVYTPRRQEESLRHVFEGGRE